ncbi:energy transducer TonB family protein, partial [Sulfuricurvum sp.]|uniref:energy transducer TonB family protein n=1 Tax=Sulfuricurvum sp. TaxID=2025608 RepID=UPI003BB6056E
SIPLDVITNDRNMIEFNLHPDGSISDISFIQKSKIDILNDTTRETIELAYAKYPRPKEKILIRYRVHYDLDKNESKKK